MIRFVVDFEFKLRDRVYWIPLMFEKETSGEAKKYAAKFKKGLSEKYEAVQRGPAPTNSPLAELLHDFRKENRDSRIAILTVLEHRKVDADCGFEFTSYERDRLAELGAEELLEHKTVIRTARYPTWVINEGENPGRNDNPRINVWI